MGKEKRNRKKKKKKIPVTPMGVLAPSLCTLDPLLGPPSV
jgi:hypothetical protein